MKRIFALAGSLLVFAGLKAQNNPPVKKETALPSATQTPGTNNTIVPKNATQKIIPKVNGEGVKGTEANIKITQKDFKVESNDFKLEQKGLKEFKDAKDIKMLKEQKDIKEIKLTPATPNNNIIIKK